MTCFAKLLKRTGAVFVGAACSAVLSAGEPSASLEVFFPHMPLLQGERVTVSILIRNGADSQLPVCAVPCEMLATQLYVATSSGKRMAKHLPLQKERARWQFVTGGTDSRLDIQPEGEYLFELGWMELPNVLPGLTEYLGRDELRFQLMVGEGKWVATGKPFEVLERPAETSWSAVHQVAVRALRGGAPHRVLFRTVVVEGQRYLFTDRLDYVCHIPPGATPQFSYDSETEVLKVSFEGANVGDVLYSVRHCRLLQGGKATTRPDRQL